MRKQKYPALLAAVLVVAVGVGIAFQKHQEKLAGKPSTPTPTGLSEFVVFYDDGVSQQEWEKDAQQFKEVYLDTASIRPNATVVNQTPPIARQIVQQNQVNTSICVSNFGSTTFNADELQTIFRSRQLSKKLVNNIAIVVKNTPFTGINIDFEQLPATDAKQFVAFLGNLHSALHQEGKTLSVDVPAETAGDKWDEGYDYAGIAQNVDEVLLMTYDYSYPRWSCRTDCTRRLGEGCASVCCQTDPPVEAQAWAADVRLRLVWEVHTGPDVEANRRVDSVQTHHTTLGCKGRCALFYVQRQVWEETYSLL